MLSIDLLIWLVVVAGGTIIWHFALPAREEVRLPLEYDREDDNDAF